MKQKLVWRREGTTTYSCRLPKDLTPEMDKDLRHIPGFRHDGETGWGAVDAVMAACHVLNYTERPKMPALPSLELPSQLRDYQVDGVRKLYGMLKHSGGALLADDVGLGKTLQAITLAKLLPGRGMVCCPAYVRETWREELAKWGITNTAVLAPITTKKSEAEWAKADKADLVISSYEMAEKAHEAAFANEIPAKIFLDEAHLVKGRKAKRALALERIAASCDYRVAMTATPMWSRPRDFYQILRILLGASRFGTKHQFDFRYSGGFINDFGGMDNRGVSHADELRLRLSCYMVRREKSEVLSELPPLTRQIVWVDGTLRAKRAFHAAVTARRRGSTWDAVFATLEEKVPVALELAHQAKRFLLLTHMKSHAAQMSRMLEQGGTPNVLITGDVPAGEKRQALVHKAIAQKCGVVATMDSVGAGIDALKNVGSIGIMHSIDWVGMKLVQAEGRLHRMGGHNNVQWLYVAMKDSMDALVVQNVVQKMDQWRAIMGKKSGASLRDDLSNDGVAAQSEEEAMENLYKELSNENE